MQHNKPAGILISLVDNKLRVSPRERVTPELLEYIKVNTQHIVRYMRDLNKKVASMTLGDFSIGNIAIKVHSETLKEDIYFISRETMMNMIASEGLVTYLHHELECLIKNKATPDVIRKIHMVKRVFPGSKIVWN